MFEELSAQQRERLFYIEYLAYFTDRVTRADIVQRFSISEAAVSKDFSLYNERVPLNVIYDPRLKAYKWGRGGKPAFIFQLHNTLSALIGRRALAVDGPPDARIPGVEPQKIKRKLDADTVAAITRAVSTNRRINCDYHSIDSGFSQKELTPTAILFDGVGWHFRAFDHYKSEYRSYSFWRVRNPQDGGANEFRLIDGDERWQRPVTAILAPHPKAAKNSRETTMLEYGMVNGCKEVELNEVSIFYYLRFWRVDTTAGSLLSPKEHPLYLANRQQLLEEGVEEIAISYSIE